MATSRLLDRRSALHLLAVGGGALALAACSEADSQTTGAAPAIEPEATVDVAALMEPGPLPEMIKGDPDAPVTIIEYASMTCGACGAFHNEVWPTIEERYVDTGQARLIVREFPFDPRAAAGVMLARCAPNDGFFPMIDVLFDRQAQWARAEDARAQLESIARLAGFSQQSFEACLTDQQLLDDVNAVRIRGAEEFGVNATPTFFINGHKYTGVLSVEQMSSIIESLL